MKIAIIGTGISGLTCGYYLHKDHDITLFEANDYIGGHTATVDVTVDGQDYAIDTGFIVYNDRTYPNFIKMMNEVGVEGIPTQMSFSVRNNSNGLEYNGHTISTLFAQKRNWVNPKFYRFIFEILRFNKLAKSFAGKEETNTKTLGEFLDEHQFSQFFTDNYILPMGAAIWSSTLADMRAFPLMFFLRFFLNHGLLDVTNRPQWYVIKGGSSAYIPPLTKGFAQHIRLNSPVESVTRTKDRVLLQVNGTTEWFDEVIFACHSDQAIKILSEPSAEEQSILGNMAYQANEVVLHTDSSLLPKRKAAWASWNYLLEGCEGEKQRLPSLTYNMNILQHVDAGTNTFCVTLNSTDQIDASKILRKFTYDHPVFTTESIAAHQRKDEIQGVSNIWFCGAYWYNGFHEDGVRSALDVVKALGNKTREQSVATLQKGAA